MTHPYRELGLVIPYEAEIISLIEKEIVNTNGDLSYSHQISAEKAQVYINYKVFLINTLLKFLKTDELPENIVKLLND